MKKTRATAIPDDIESLKQQPLEMQVLLQKAQREATHFQQLYHHALEQWQLALRKRFAASS